ncbi:hypothetical protein ACFYTC_43250 [Actinomadura nitritigenes]|uniref:hypothetical protein n=1 Tax=Actinomadura nitritigenes TaxID=134602 RepID=UPI0036CE1466
MLLTSIDPFVQEFERQEEFGDNERVFVRERTMGAFARVGCHRYGTAPDALPGHAGSGGAHG